MFKCEGYINLKWDKILIGMEVRVSDYGLDSFTLNLSLGFGGLIGHL